jgi:hypothetical protein
MSLCAMGDYVRTSKDAGKGLQERGLAYESKRGLIAWNARS